MESSSRCVANNERRVGFRYHHVSLTFKQHIVVAKEQSSFLKRARLQCKKLASV